MLEELARNLDLKPLVDQIHSSVVGLIGADPAPETPKRCRPQSPGPATKALRGAHALANAFEAASRWGVDMV